MQKHPVFQSKMEEWALFYKVIDSDVSTVITFNSVRYRFNVLRLDFLPSIDVYHLKNETW